MLSAEIPPPERLRFALEAVFAREITAASASDLRMLAEFYPSTFSWSLQEGDQGLQMGASKAERKRHGAYYTPEPMARELVRFAVVPSLDREGSLRVTVCDPACGAGGLLLAAAEAIA